MDYVGKPAATGEKLFSIREELIEKIKAAKRAKVRRPYYSVSENEILKFSTHPPERSLIAIGSSTGGVEALRCILPLMPADSPPILIVQHMPAQFTTSFANRMDGLSAINVVEAQDGMKIEKGTAYIAAGGLHLRLIQNKGRPTLKKNNVLFLRTTHKEEIHN
jgi:two-component system chemotaxis response regulator CheB